MLEKYIKNSKIRNIAEWIITIVLAWLCYLFISNFVYGTAEISGPSMNPTLYHGERVFINKMIYQISSPQKGDIVTFPYYGNRDENYIKRIVGCSNDVIDLIGNEIYINGEKLDDGFSNSDSIAAGNIEYPFIVPEGSYFVLGDNRNNSKDSRLKSVGCIQEDDIFGKISIRFMPLNRAGFIE